MNRRTLVAALLFLPLAACTVNLVFDIDKQFQVVSAASGSIAQSQSVNLADYKEVSDHKGNVKSLDLEFADLTVTAVNPGNRATAVSGTLVLRGDRAPADGSQDVLVGTLTSFPLSAGSTVRLPGSPALDAFLFDELQSSGQFAAILKGTVDGATNVAVDVKLHASLAYDSGIL